MLLRITRPGSLLSLVMEREVDERHVEIIRLVLESDLTYGEALAIFGKNNASPELIPWWERPPVNAQQEA